MILAEDTRTSQKLLSHFDIKTPLRAYHAHNEHNVVATIVQRACVREGVVVECLPGATAFVPALVASGLPCDVFHYEGFLPHKKGRQTRLKYLATLSCTFVLYESPHRLLRCLEEFAAVCGGERLACVCREISKLHAEVKTASLHELLQYYQQHTDKVRGEIVIVVDANA